MFKLIRSYKIIEVRQSVLKQIAKYGLLVRKGLQGQSTSSLLSLGQQPVKSTSAMIARRVIFFLRMMKQAIQEFLADNCTHLAAAISYYVLLSLFPLALAAISILSYVSRSPDVQAKVTQAITDVLPVSGDFVSTTIRDVAPGWGAASAIGVLGLVWAGTGLFNATRKSLNTAWGIKQPRTFLRERLIEFLMMLGLGAFLLLYVGMTATFNFLQSTNVFGGRFAEGGIFWEFMVVLVSIAIAFIGFLLLYEFIPNTRVPWRHVWVGALIAAVLFEIVKNVFVWFVGKFATYNLVYGSIGTIIALMTWSYISAMIMLFCAKVISIYPRMKSSLLEEAHVDTETVKKSDGDSPVTKFLINPKPAAKEKN
jgi:membrane protein